ncbi:MAG: rhomboid family intramembrane serine protease [Bacteroidota bacterium]
MASNQKRSFLSQIPGYQDNAVLHLIIALAVIYMMMGISWAVIMLVYSDAANFNQYFSGNVALPHLAYFKSHWWTIITYGWFQYPNGFFELLSNMLWLYCFGSVVQMLVGPRQIIPLFAYSLIAGGAVYLAAQLMPGELGKCPPLILGPRAGLMAMATAAVTLTPKYRFYLTETFSIPIMVVAGIFTVLMIFSTGFYIPIMLLLAGGGFAGYAYIKLLQAGYRPGGWIYNLGGKMESLVTPNEQVIRQKKGSRRIEVINKVYSPKTGISQKKIDDILDKINQKGYNSLSAEEKDILVRAGKED